MYAWTIFFLLPLLAWAEQVTVAHIVDGDTFVTTTGQHVRLLDINTPEQARENTPAEPFAHQARQAAHTLLANQPVTLAFGPTRTDRYQRLLAHVYLADGTWVNGALVEEGLAHVYSFPDNRPKTAELIVLENAARNQKRGLWQHPRWQVWPSTAAFPATSIGKFNLVEGTVTHTALIKGITYLNFGDDWRTDFTVEIRARDLPLFTAAGLNPQQDYMGKTLRVRGVLKPVNGVLITATHPEQLEILQ